MTVASPRFMRVYDAQRLKTALRAIAPPLRLAHLEAIRHFERGVALLPALAQGRERDRREIELQLARGLSLFTTEGFVSDAAGEAYARAHELSEQLGDARQLFMAVFGLWVSANGKGGMAECRQFSHRLQQLTTADADDGLRLQAHHSAWTTCLFSGEPAAVREHCEVGRRLYDPERHRLHRQLYGGHDPGACALYMGAQAHWSLGYPDTGLAIGREVLALAERIAHPFTLGTALLMNAVLHLDRDEPEVALQQIEAAEALAEEQRIGLVIEPQILRGAVMTAQGAFEEAVTHFRDGLSQPRAIQLRHYGVAWLAEALSHIGECHQALAAVGKGLEDQEPAIRPISGHPSNPSIRVSECRLCTLSLLHRRGLGSNAVVQSWALDPIARRQP
jgi:tetratricopeptide (TPR) repeat protein